jgi:hypothetical protein
MPMSPVVTKVGWGYFSLSCCKKYLLLTWGRCYDHDFLRLSAKIGVFLKNQCYYQIFT